MRLILTLLLLTFSTIPALAQELDCENAMTQTDMNICALQEFEAADAELNTHYQAAIALTKGYDQDTEVSGNEEALRESQRAWVEYRDTACRSETLLSEGGTIQPLLISSCMTRLTLRRSEDLETMYNDM